jgi:hypothetical protein
MKLHQIHPFAQITHIDLLAQAQRHSFGSLKFQGKIPSSKKKFQGKRLSPTLISWVIAKGIV